MLLKQFRHFAAIVEPRHVNQRIFHGVFPTSCDNTYSVQHSRRHLSRGRYLPEEYMAQDVRNDKLLLIKIEGMHCHKCEQAITKALNAQPGVQEVEVDFPSRQASVLFDPSAVTVKELTQAVTSAGYKVAGFTQGHADPASHS